jgi:hypothetical protein
MSLDDLFRKAEGQAIPGGCDTCSAYQTIESLTPGVHKLTVHHDNDCPTLRAMKAEAN